MSKSKGYVDTSYLQVAANLLQQVKQRSYTHIHLQPGLKLLDVGCGPGTDTIPLAQFVAPTGLVVGVDYDPAMIVEAKARAEQAGLGGVIRHETADAASLPFEAGEFDVSRSERLFQHLPNSAQALAEMVRVTKPSGRIVVVDTDWGTFSIDTPENDIERKLLRFYAERFLHNGYSG